MSRLAVSGAFVGNEFVVHAPRRVKINPLPAIATPQTAASGAAQLPIRPREFTVSPVPAEGFSAALESVKAFFYRYSLTLFILLFLAVAGSGTGVAINYWSAHVAAVAESRAAASASRQAFALLNTTVSSGQLPAELQKIEDQTATLSISNQTVAISASTIRGWLQITPNAAKTQDSIYVNPASISSSVIQLANSFVTAPVNQVSVNHSDGITPSGIILSGQDGTQLINQSSLTTQAQQLAPNVLGGKGLQFSASLGAVPYQSVTPAAFSKLIEVDVTTKRLYAYQDGQLVNTYLVTAGAPATPTPLGEFHIWEKVTNQTMVGPGYVQPNVPWINYFDHSGDAIHGNYWRPTSVFGNVNTSHGCVGVQVPEAEWIYDWAPLGTTIIIHS
jgi:lipoprotein-anchoring transpeptidase ErfK/SrfK